MDFVQVFVVIDEECGWIDFYFVDCGQCDFCIFGCWFVCQQYWEVQIVLLCKVVYFGKGCCVVVCIFKVKVDYFQFVFFVGGGVWFQEMCFVLVVWVSGVVDGDDYDFFFELWVGERDLFVVVFGKVEGDVVDWWFFDSDGSDVCIVGFGVGLDGC